MLVVGASCLMGATVVQYFYVSTVAAAILGPRAIDGGILGPRLKV